MNIHDLTQVEADAANGDSAAMVALGFSYMSINRGLNYDLARHWYEKAASLGNSDAMRRLAKLYEYGFGVTKDESIAHDWYKMAADRGNTEAMVGLGYLWSGLKGDSSVSYRWYEKAALLGDLSGMRVMGLIYLQGRGVEKDYVVAKQWLEKAVAEGDKDAMRILGDLPREDADTFQNAAH